MARKLPKLTILFSFFHSHPLLSWGRGVNIQLFFCVWSVILMQKVCIVFIGGRVSSQSEWRQHKSVWEITVYITFENGNYLFLHSALLPNLAASQSPRQHYWASHLTNKAKALRLQSKRCVKMRLPLALVNRQDFFTCKHTSHMLWETGHWKFMCKCRGNIFLITLALAVAYFSSSVWISALTYLTKPLLICICK